MSKPTREYIYGINPAFEVIRAVKRKVYEAFLDETRLDQPRFSELVEMLENNTIPVRRVDRRRVNDLAGNRDHQGVVLKTGIYPYRKSDALWSRPRILLLDNVEDPHNVGGILRSAEIFGFDAVLLSEKGVPEIYPSVVKVSAGATEYLDIARDAPPESYVRTAREKGYRIIALDTSGRTDIRSLPDGSPDRLMVVIGGEDRSVSPFVLDHADHVVSIGQKGRINSLNAAIAAGIALFVLQKE
ncbi:MAG TPA: RNA methyltransferase [bacterium]|nr:RNA methyltransferase [bacterium]